MSWRTVKAAGGLGVRWNCRDRIIDSNVYRVNNTVVDLPL
jgi:hypothetical protein